MTSDLIREFVLSKEGYIYINKFKAIIQALQLVIEGNKIVIITNTFVDAHDLSLDVCRMLNSLGVDYTFNHADMRMSIFEGSITFVGTNRVEKIKGWKRKSIIYVP